MKTILNRITRWHVAALAVALLVASVAAAPLYTISFTTLNGSISASQTTLVLTSASASSGSSFGAPAAGQCLWVDRELMRITGTSSTTMTVTRANSTPAPHLSGATIWTAPCAQFKTVDPPISTGNVTCTAYPLPWINTSNGNVWTCNPSNSKWEGTNVAPITYNSVQTAP